MECLYHCPRIGFPSKSIMSVLLKSFAFADAKSLYFFLQGRARDQEIKPIQ